MRPAEVQICGHRVLGAEQAKVEIDDRSGIGIVDRLAGHGLDHTGNRCAIRGFRAKSENIVEVVAFARLQHVRGQPVRHDIVVELVLDRDFDQIDGALCPSVPCGAIQDEGRIS